jgi:hypothetical protein
MIEALNCPKCGAPMPLPAGGGPWLCVYCASIVRVSLGPQEAPQATLAGEASAEDVAEIKQLLLSGRAAEAEAHYARVTGAGPAQTHAAVEQLRQQISANIMRRQQLTPIGWIMAGLAGLAVAASACAGLAGALSPGWAIGLALFPVSLLVVFSPGLLTSLRYLTARTAPAAVLNYTYLGRLQARGREIYAFRILVEVRPPNEQPFRAEFMAPVREQSRAHLQPGALLQVKYRPGEPHRVIFDRRLSQP